MSFGFSIGDFLTLSSLTLKLYKSFKNAPGEFSEISRELHSFYIVVADLMDQAGDPKSCLSRHGQARKLELVALRDNLISTMEELQIIHQRYQQMGRMSWSRFSLGQEDLATIRSKLTVQILAVNSFVGSLNMATLGRMEPMLEKIFWLLDEQAKGSLDQAETVLSAMIEEDGVSWARLEMNLRTEGISLEYIRENKEQIRGALSSVVEINNLEGVDDDSIYADDSISRVGYFMEDEAGRSALANAKTVHPTNVEPYPPNSQKPDMSPSPQGQSKVLAPYVEWVEDLSPDENVARIKLMNQGFDFQEYEKARSSRSATIKGQPELDSTMVYWAASNDQKRPLELLLQRGCDPSSKKNGIPVVIHAAQAQHWGIVRLLVEFGADINTGYNIKAFGSGPGLLHLVIESFQYDLMELLLDMGTSLIVRNEHGHTPLHVAVRSYNYKAVKILLRRGADANVKTTDYEKSALMLIPELQEIKYLSKLSARQRDNLVARGLRMTRLLIDNRIELNQQDCFGHSALHLGIQRKANSWVRLLLDEGADPNVCIGWSNTTPLHVACEIRDVELVNLLLERGAEVNVHDMKGRTPLHFAAQNGSYQISRLLVENGADIDMCGWYSEYGGVTGVDYTLGELAWTNDGKSMAVLGYKEKMNRGCVRYG